MDGNNTGDGLATNTGARMGAEQQTRQGSGMTRVLWAVQGLLALLFLYTGGMKLALPLKDLSALPLPGLLIRFIGVAEVLGAAGLILPGLLRIRTGLTPLAAAGLVVIMIGATDMTLKSGPALLALLPLTTGLLCVFVAWGRWRLAPHPETRRSPDGEF